MKGLMTEQKHNAPTPASLTIRRIIERIAPEPDRPCPRCRKLESAGYLDEYGMCYACMRASQQKDDRKTRLAVLWHNAHMPKSAKGVKFENTDPARTNSEAIRACQEWAYKPTGLYLWGPTGVGKTRLALCMARREILENERQVLFLDMPRLFQDLKESFQTESKEPRRLLSAARSIPLLVLDDIGAGHSPKFGENEILPLVNARLEEGLPTIYTSNLSWSQKNAVAGFTAPSGSGKGPLEYNLGTRVAQRIVKSSQAVNVNGQANWLVK